MDEQINVSRNALRAELAQLELRLVDRLTSALDHKADQAVLDQAIARVSALELARAERVHMPKEVASLSKRVAALERFRWAFPSIATVMALAGLALAMAERL